MFAVRAGKKQTFHPHRRRAGVWSLQNCKFFIIWEYNCLLMAYTRAILTKLTSFVGNFITFYGRPA